MSLESLLDVLTYVQEKDDLTGNEVLVLIAIANYTDKDGKGARASHTTLNRIVKLKGRALKYTVDRLVRRGLLAEMRITTGRGGYTYDLLVPPIGPLHKKTGVNCNLQQHEYQYIATCNKSNTSILQLQDPLRDPKEKDPEKRARLLEFLGMPEGSDAWAASMNGHLPKSL